MSPCLPPPYVVFLRSLGPANLVVPFVACGDLSGFDADKSYPLETGEEGVGKDGGGQRGGGYRRIPPVQMPIGPPHETYRMRKAGV